MPTSLAIVLGLTLLAATPGFAFTPAEAAAADCKSLLDKKAYNQAIERCGEAVRLDPKLPEPYFLRASAHDAIWQQAANTPERIQEHRVKALASFRQHLELNRGDTDERRRQRVLALGGLLLILLRDGEVVGDLEHAHELARAPSLTRRDRLVLAAAYSRHARPELSEKFLKQQVDADPKDAEACQFLARLYSEPVWKGRARFDDTVATLERCASLTPTDPTGYYVLTTFLWDKAFRDDGLSDAQKLAYLDRAQGHVDRALALKKDFWEALVYKGLIFRGRARAATDVEAQKRLIAQAQSLQKQALDLKNAGVPPHAGLQNATLLAPPPPPPPPPPPRPVPTPRNAQSARPLEIPPPPPAAPVMAVRVGGQIKEPKKLKDVPPDYPSIAMQARVQGIVILECTISPEGKVVEVKVLRGIPLLDQAAIDSVKQWEYAPTLLNGVPVPVIMTVTVNFRLS